MEFRQLPPAPDHPRYLKRLKDIDSLLANRKERLVEEGMMMDAATALDDLHWFCKRFTSFSTYQIEERGHPMLGRLWIDHPFVFWLCRQYQEILEEPQDGWVWVEVHRLGVKTTTLLAAVLREHAKNPSRTVGLWTHKAEEIGTGMGRGVLADIQTDKLRDHFPQFRHLQEGTKQGYVVDRDPGPREQSLTIYSILTSTASAHPDIFLFDDVVTDKLRDNPEQIAKISKNISAIAAMMTPDCPVIVNNTRWDEADPMVQRLKEGLFVRHIKQAATTGGDFTPPGEANMHTRKFFDRRRREINDDSIYFPQYELVFHKQASILFDWKDIPLYDQKPEDLAALSPFIHIIIDGAGGRQGSDFTFIRVATWISHDCWANLDCIRERVGWSKAAQILLGRDTTDPSTKWIENYCPEGVGIIEKWMRIDPKLVLWFDDNANQGWIEHFQEACRVRTIRFTGGKLPTIKAIPQVHHNTIGGKSPTKLWQIQKLDGAYSGGKAAYPRSGFGHGSWHGLAGEDKRDTMIQFRQDEFDRMKLGKLPPFDDGLDTERVFVMPQAVAMMRRPAKGGGHQLGGVVYPRPTIMNPFGLPRGATLPQDPMQGRTYVSM